MAAPDRSKTNLCRIYKSLLPKNHGALVLKHRIHVCGLRNVSKTSEAIGAGHLVSAIEAHSFPKTPRNILRGRHLRLDMDDIAQAQPDMVLPSERHVLDLLDFVQSWDQKSPLLVHCFAGMSRSTACAYIAICALNPQADEERIGQSMRRLSATATPNRRLVALADDILGRDGRMIAAVSDMHACFNDVATPFSVGPSDFLETA
ncbi:tyrosine phosphatase family protein [Hyphomicrobium sp.]|jgi:predicted protein tyrosine phosphatase|uniref:tyrosine phosphatase family protein n=1 Tax=Hyphomicrobium sp. TaxID=82 RepID=UPI003564070C